MKLTENLIQLLILLPVFILGLYSLIVIIGNHTILRAGGTSAHENYPKIIGHLKLAYIFITISFLLFFLVIFGFVPSETVVTLVSVGVGMFGALVIKEQKN